MRTAEPPRRPGRAAHDPPVQPAMSGPAEPSDQDALDGASDAILADRAADGDARAFEVLVRRYSRLLLWYAGRALGTLGDHEDIVQEALITAWQQLPSLADRAALRGWLVRITTRKALDHLRALKHHDDVDEVEVAAPEGAGPEGSLAATALGDSLTAALASLPEGQRQAWTLRELGGCSYDEIAAELGVPASTVRGLLARARRSLMHDMDGWR